MKKTSYFIPGILILIFLAPAIFYSCFAVGMISSNSPKTIKQDWVKQYKSIVKNTFINIKDVDIYYRQGRVRFDFTSNSDMPLDECKQVIKETKDFIDKETVSRPLIDKSFGDQLNIMVKFDTKTNIYVFESPYWIKTEDTANNQDNFVENHYKVWYLQINNEPQTKILF